MDGPDFDSWDESDSSDTVACPACRQMVYEDAEQCPNCGIYISEEDESLPHTKPLWFVIAAVLCLATVIFLWVLP